MSRNFSIVRASIALALIASALFPSTALAAKGGGGRTAASASTLTLNQADPRLGSSVSFTATYPGSVKNPRVSVMCYQAGVVVYGEAGNVDHVFVLGGASSDWLRSGGPADCVADLFYFVWTGQQQHYYWLATTTFRADG